MNALISIEAAALAYANRGWKPVPTSCKTKKALGAGWPKTPFSPHQFNGNAQNVAVQLGAVSGGLCDVDLDVEIAIGLAPKFLPETGAIFGRRSKPASHQFYFSDLHKTEKDARIAYQEYVGGKLGTMIAELRIGGGGKGILTTLPPSMHVTGERVEWVSEGEPARVNAFDLAFDQRLPFERVERREAVNVFVREHVHAFGSDAKALGFSGKALL